VDNTKQVDLVSLERRIELVESLVLWTGASVEEGSDIVGTVRDDGDTRFGIRLRAHCKEFVMLWVAVGERSTSFETFLMPYPQKNEVLVLQYLLRRNYEMTYLHSAQHRDEALYLVGRAKTSDMSSELLDTYLGAALAATEELFPTAMALGFGSSYRYRPVK
jgi:hypothetical protein